ncbi:MAG TPA: hypothetical protein VEP91_10200 [Solirubrobacterales bacterium]|nr:hypothetical protein [Solirubrobacterales bacterium]
MFAPARLQLVGCALLAAFLVAGCGGGGTDSTAPATLTSAENGDRFHDSGSQRNQKGGNDAGRSAGSEGTGRHVPAGDLCQSQLGGFVGSMDGLRRRLAVGVTYDQYVAEVRGIRSTYGEIPTDRLQIDCLATVATPGEKAFNRYIEAANDWGECVSELGCGSEEIEPVLQRRWRIASHFLSEAQDGLKTAG